MTEANKTTDPAVVLIQRLLSGPERPGQTFSMPGTTYDELYRLARRFSAAFTDAGNASPVCIITDDRSVLAAAMLASLAGGPNLLIPDDLTPTALADLHRKTGFTRVIASSTESLPTPVDVIQPEQLIDEVETLAPDEDPDADRPWVFLFTCDSAESPGLWTKTPRNLLGEAAYLTSRFGIGSGDRILATIPAVNLYGLMHSLLVPLVASARVVAQTPLTIERIGQLMADTSPTIFVSVPDHYRALRSNPPDKGALRLACSSTGPLAQPDGAAFSHATGVNLVDIYGTPATGGIATRCREKGEVCFKPYDCIQWRVAGESLDIQSAFLSAELPVRESGWYTIAQQVRANGNDGFAVIDRVKDGAVKDGSQQGSEAIAPVIAAPEEIENSTGYCRIKFEPAGLSVPIDADKTLYALGADHNIDIRADCGGIGVCGKCRVIVHPKKNFSALTAGELDVLTPDETAAGCRLACQAKPAGKGTVTIPDTMAERSETRGKTGISGSYPVDAIVRRVTVAGHSPELTTDNMPESLVDWLAIQIDDPAAATADITALRQLARYRDSMKAFTLVVHEASGIYRILDSEQTASLGFAVDLGTTSVAGYLCDLNTGRLLAADACVNPQRRFGEDVISRISRINEKEAYLEQFQQLAVEGINAIMARCLEQVGASPESIDELTVCGNTTMQQVFAGLHPHGLGVTPYLPLTLTPPAINAGDLGLNVDPAVPVFLMPMISGFVGGDTMAAILADRPHERDDITLIMDIGTNGEVALGGREQLWVTSCATGPALEGAQISCGMRAVSGAIHRVRPDGGSGIAYEVMGNGKNRPMGICGSGIIDTIAALHQLGIILPNGRLNEASPGVSTDATGVGRYYTVARSDRTATGSNIAISLKDIRQIQLAKGALSTGIEFLMRKAGIDRIDRAILTGAFGARFNWKNALSIGMLPPAVGEAEVISKDNLAGVGVVMALLDKKMRTEARDLCRRIRYLELATDPAFAMAFAMATSFPETAV